jgi:hypothetical protein
MELYGDPPALVLLGGYDAVEEATPGFVVLQHSVVEVDVLGQGEELAPHDQTHGEKDPHRHGHVRVTMH